MSQVCIAQNYVCPVCKIDPSSHSFKIIKADSTRNVYYTCPADCTNTDTDSIIAHYDGMLQENKATSWYWVVDCKGFGIKQALEIHTASQLATLIVKYSQNLKKIIIVNANIYIKSILAIVKPLLSEKVQNIITFRV